MYFSFLILNYFEIANYRLWLHLWPLSNVVSITCRSPSYSTLQLLDDNDRNSWRSGHRL